VRRQRQQRRQRRLLAALLLRLLPLELAAQLPDGAGCFHLWPVFQVIRRLPPEAQQARVPLLRSAKLNVTSGQSLAKRLVQSWARTRLRSSRGSTWSKSGRGGSVMACAQTPPLSTCPERAHRQER